MVVTVKLAFFLFAIQVLTFFLTFLVSFQDLCPYQVSCWLYMYNLICVVLINPVSKLLLLSVYSQIPAGGENSLQT